MRISYWSSDVCSSDLCARRGRYGRHGQVALGERRVDAEMAKQRFGRGLMTRGQAAQPGFETFLGQRPHPKRQRLDLPRSEEHTSELPSLMRIPSAVFCLKKNKNN